MRPFQEMHPTSKSVDPKPIKLENGISFSVSDASPNLNPPSRLMNPSLNRFPKGELGQIVNSSKNIKEANNLSSSNCTEENGFVEAALYAYSHHCALTIRPDDVWISLGVQFSFYLNANSEELRDKFVDFEGKKSLTVSTPYDMFHADWTQLAAAMGEQVVKNIKEPWMREWIVPNFSTTTPSDKMVGSILLMSGMKNFFDYNFMCGCGLTAVNLLGSVEDWKEIRKRAERFVEFDNKRNEMKSWSQLVLPVLDRFISSAEGTPDTEWWNSLINEQGGGSFVPYVSGWMIAFCAFTKEGKYAVDPEKARYVHSIPAGFVSCPVNIDNNGTQYKGELVAGHFTGQKLMDEGRKTIVVTPQIDWALVVTKEGEEKPKSRWS